MVIIDDEEDEQKRSASFRNRQGNRRRKSSLNSYTDADGNQVVTSTYVDAELNVAKHRLLHFSLHDQFFAKGTRDRSKRVEERQHDST